MATSTCTAHEPEFSAWQWVAWRRCRSLIVPFKRDTYTAGDRRLRGTCA